jgi:hypothetical protein
MMVPLKPTREEQAEIDLCQAERLARIAGYIHLVFQDYPYPYPWRYLPRGSCSLTSGVGSKADRPRS